MSDHLSQWIGNRPVTREPAKKQTSVEPTVKMDVKGDTELLEYLFNWIRVLLMGGSVRDGALKKVDEDINDLAKRHGIDLWDVEWIPEKLKKAASSNDND